MRRRPVLSGPARYALDALGAAVFLLGGTTPPDLGAVARLEGVPRSIEPILERRRRNGRGGWRSNVPGLREQRDLLQATNSRSRDRQRHDPRADGDGLVGPVG